LTSEYGITTIANIVNNVQLPFNTYMDSSLNRVYSDTNIEYKITQSERLVLGWIDQMGLTSSTAPALVKYCIDELTTIKIKNDLLRDGYINSDSYSYIDPDDYFKNVIKDILLNQKNSASIKSYQGVDNYDG